MPYETVWESNTLRSRGGEGYFDDELVRAAARGAYDEVKRLMKGLIDQPADLGTLPEGLETPPERLETPPEELDTRDGASRMEGVVEWAARESGFLRHGETSLVALHAAALGGNERIVRLLLEVCKVDI